MATKPAPPTDPSSSPPPRPSLAPPPKGGVITETPRTYNDKAKT